MRVLADVANQRGISSDVLLDVPGHSGALHDEFLDIAAFRALFTRALELTEQPALGLLCGLTAQEPSFGVVGPLVSHARTMRQALEIGAQFQPLVLTGGSIHISERAGRACIRFSAPSMDPLLDRAFSELIAAGLWRLLLVYGGGKADVDAVSFRHARPNYHHAYTAAFHGAEQFARPFNGLDLDSRALDRPNLHSLPELHAVVRAQAERCMERLSRPLTVTERLEALLRAQTPQVPGMTRCAQELGMSVRSLRRHLTHEATSFRVLTDSARQNAAYVMLRNPALSLQAVGYSLGFTTPSAFHRAFKRWSGLTPAQYQARVQAGLTPSG